MAVLYLLGGGAGVNTSTANPSAQAKAEAAPQPEAADEPRRAVVTAGAGGASEDSAS